MWKQTSCFQPVEENIKNTWISELSCFLFYSFIFSVNIVTWKYRVTSHNLLQYWVARFDVKIHFQKLCLFLSWIHNISPNNINWRACVCEFIWLKALCRRLARNDDLLSARWRKKLTIILLFSGDLIMAATNFLLCPRLYREILEMSPAGTPPPLLLLLFLSSSQPLYAPLGPPLPPL